MEQEAPICFGPFRLDPMHEQVWRGEEAIGLGSKAFALLYYLATHPGRLVKKDELLKQVWARTYVTPTVLKVHMHAIRQALGEEADAPRYIETVPRLGYRFVGEEAAEEADRATTAPRLGGRNIVGRETEVEQLQDWLTQALRGERRVVFITGEPGIGKTAVVDLFLNRIQQSGQVWVGRGQCLEQYGEGEAYLPVLEAFGQLGQEPGGTRVVTVLRQYAPTWLIQMPALVAETDFAVLQQRVHGATRERMLREMTEAIEALTAERGLVLVFEDLHWSDRSTLELLAYLTQRRERARLLVIGTYRPSDIVVSDHPLKGIKQELHARGYCDELSLELLTEDEVKAYIAARLGIMVPSAELVTVIHQRTEGNPLFMVNVVEYCLQQGVLYEANDQWRLQSGGEDLGVPENLRQLIAKQIENLEESVQRMLEVASVAGMEFAVASVAAGLKRELDDVEEACEELAWNGHLLSESGLAEWPDGTVSGQYAFRHALYQNVLYERVAEVRRVRLHRAIGEREEGAYSDHASQVATELAVHFERGRDYARAVRYLELGGENADRRSAHHEAVRQLTKAIELLKTFPETPERRQHELKLQLALGIQLMGTKGFSAPEVEAVCSREQELLQQLDKTPQFSAVLQSLRGFHFVRAELKTALELAEQQLLLAQQTQEPSDFLLAYYSLGETSLYAGEFKAAWSYLGKGITLCHVQLPRVTTFYVHHPGVSCLSSAGMVFWIRGYPDQALKHTNQAIAFAQKMAHPLSEAFALSIASMSHVVRREIQPAQVRAEAALALANEYGFPHWSAVATGMLGWALGAQGRHEEGMRLGAESLAAYMATGARVNGTFGPTLMAAGSLQREQPDEGLAILAGGLALVDNTGERIWEAELYRLKGELLLQQSRIRSPESSIQSKQRAKGKGQMVKGPNLQSLAPNPQAEACFQQAIDIARHQEAKIFELRAVMSLSHLWQQQGKQKQARKLLAEIYAWFTEGFDTPDLQDAKALLEALR